MGDRAGSHPLTYDPAADLAARYPDWRLGSGHLGGVVPEVLSRAHRVILVEEALDEASRRSCIAHAVAHLDLDHGATMAGYFENREEAAADQLAAGRLIPLDRLAHALAWSRKPDEVAAELNVDPQMLRARERFLTRAERRRLRRAVSRFDECD